LAEPERNVLQYAICINGQLVTSQLEDASDKVKVFDFSSPAKLLHDVQLPDIGTVVSISGKHDDTELLYKFSSFTDAGSSYRIDMTKFETERLYVTKLAEGSPDPSEFVTD
jgi:prolyl oligopeptidase PreP (S9A serine peptidase family)